MTFPRQIGQIPIYYDYLNTGRPKEEGIYNEFVSYYIDEKNSPYYPFGFGLSYSNFIYKDLTLNQHHMTVNDKIHVTIIIKNDSPVPGYEVIQLYIKDHKGSISRPIKELKQFKKVYFKAHEEKQISFELTLKDLTYINSNNQEIYENGKFSVMVGQNSEQYLLQDFVLD